ncbi:MAG TPA: C1 family peptidase [Bacteroidales bacterium]|nr:C1 family peptidase [Bacteroidales bacterium]
MKIRTIISVIIVGAIFALPAFGQNKDKAVFRTNEAGYFQNTILKDVRDMKEKHASQPDGKSFAVDLVGQQLPNKVALYKSQSWHNPPISQGNSNTCWCFSTTSFLESEVYRINKMKVKLSEMYTVYWEYVEKVRRYVKERGNSEFAEGSEANAVTRIWEQYGAVPESDYTGLLDGRKFPSHADMIAEMTGYLNWMKASSAWDENAAVSTIKSILKHYIGEPPSEVTVEGKKMTPLQYMHDYIRINPDDYVDILSYEQEPFYRHVEYKVPDNWWHSADYCNVPLDVFMETLKKAVRTGYSASIGGDVSEAGFDRKSQVAMVPDFDVPSAYINDDARQFRFTNGTTTDDHGMHLVGYMEKDGKDWYLIKDSGSGSRNNDPNAPEFGYYFFTEDYVKLKMMDFMVHKDAVKDLLLKIK